MTDSATTTQPASTYPAVTAETAPIVAPVHTLGILSLVLGIIAVVSGFQFVVGAAAIVVGFLALRQEPASTKFAIAGIVTGAVAATSVMWWIAGAAALIPLLPFAFFPFVF